MGHLVKFVSEDELPDGYDWFIAKQRQGDDYLFAVNPEAICEQLLEDAWIAFCKLSAA